MRGIQTARRTFVEGFFLTVVLTLIHVVIFFSSYESDLSGDAIVYDVAAKSFAEKGQLLQPSDGAIFLGLDHPKTEREFESLHMFAPGYPIFVGIVYKIFGSGEVGRKAVALIQVFLICFILPLLFLKILNLLRVDIGSRLVHSLPFLIVGFWYAGFASARLIYSEVLTSVVLTLLFYLFLKVEGEVKIESRPRNLVGQHLLLVCVAGILFFIRYEFIFAIGLAYILYFLKMVRENREALLGHGLVFLFSLLIIITPAVRNFINLGELIPLTSVSGRLLWLGSVCSDASDFSVKYRNMFENLYDPQSPKNTDRGLMIEAKKNIQTNTTNYIKCMFKKARTLFVIENREPAWGSSSLARVVKIGMRVFKVTCLICFLIVIPMVYRKFKIAGTFLIAIFIIKYLLMHLLLWGNARYFVTFEPITMVLTILLMIRLWRKDVADSWPKTP